MKPKTICRSALFALFSSLLLFGVALAQTVEERLAKAEAALASAQTAGDNAWMLTSSALVLMMTGPGLALFYGGLVRKKNVLATMMQSFILMAVITVIWAIFGYSLAFAKGSSFIGGFDYLFLKDVGAAPSGYAATIPHQTFMIFQLMFAIITPALITGAFAERMKFSAHAALLLAVGGDRLLPAGSHGLGQWRTVERVSGRKDSGARFRGRHGGAHLVGIFGAGLRDLSGQTSWLSARLR